MSEDRGIKPLVLLHRSTHLRSLTIAASDFILVNPASWEHQPRLTRVAVEDSGEHALRVPGPTLARSLAYAIPHWSATVSTLQLHCIEFDCDCAFAIADLHQLTHLGLFPGSVHAGKAHLLLDVENDNLCTAEARLESYNQQRCLAHFAEPGLIYLDNTYYRHVPALPCFLSPVASEDALLLLKLCIPSLHRLTVLHLGLYAAPKPQPVRFPDGIVAQLAVIQPSLLIVSLGPVYGTRDCAVHVHCARSCLCSDRNGFLSPHIDPECALSLHDLCTPIVLPT
ncbi:hypothetical protein AURDEDRAFT_159230 [Auricularia subglabra TFB-10046 SS5]|nr:hypothetical protein AURDEDRAFT_159230 [Auricularia subglabra TFB-10046 SS5]